MGKLWTLYDMYQLQAVFYFKKLDDKILNSSELWDTKTCLETVDIYAFFHEVINFRSLYTLLKF